MYYTPWESQLCIAVLILVCFDKASKDGIDRVKLTKG